MLQNEQNENFMPPELVNQGSIKRYTDLPSTTPANLNFRKPQRISSNFNSFNNQNIQMNSNILKSQENQSQKKEIIVPEDKPVIPEKTISDFYQNDFLADAILKVDENEIKFHKVILCAASEFLYKYFSTNKSNEENQGGIQTVLLPEIMKSSFSRGNKKECAEKIMKYCYNNQDIKSIESDITQYNCFTLLELAHCLGIKSLNKNLEKLIIKQFLKDDNMIKISEESNYFELPELHKECSNRIKKKIGNVSNKGRELTELNYETFKDIISSDEIDLEGEKEVADLVLEYIKSRREIPEEKIVEKVEIKVNQEIINQENEEHKEEEKKEEEENKEEEKKDEEEEKKEEEKKEEEQNNEENKQENNPPPQNPEDDPYNQWKKHLEEIEKNSQKKKLTKDEEKALIYCIRFSFLSHADLISLSNDPIMQDYKDLVLQGLSARLNTYENTDDQKHLINLTPRHYLRGQQVSNINNQNMSNNNMYNNGDINQNYDQNQMIKSVGNFGEQNRYNNQYNIPPKNYAQTYQNRPPSNNDMNSNMNNNFSESRSYYGENNNNYNDYNTSNQMRTDIMNVDDMNSKKKKLGLMIKSSTSPYPPQDPRISEDFFRNQLIMSVPKPIFKYTYDFDENGALYFLGTKGKRHQYRNPHEINMVKAFASSISKGQVSDFVGRNLVNLRTENEENSFFGVDLGKNRTLVPTAYSLRNRNSSSHVMLCWNLEASNDKINFEILDTRIFSNVNNPQIHQKLEKERNLLREPGCTSTWGISKKIKERFPEGFRYFLIKQIDKNSNGSYNLAISGFELYGEGKGKGWIFN